MNAILFASWLASTSPVAACSPEPRLTVSVVAEHHPPAVRSSYSLGQLRDFAARAGHRGQHAPLGFYAGTFGYTVDVRAEEAGAPGCASVMHVRVGMLLGDRLIEVGADGPCRPEAVLSHYLVHADQDDRLLSRYASRALAMFDRTPLTDLLGTAAQDNSREAVAVIVRRAMDGLLQSYDEDRPQALEAADSDEELAKLREACGRAL